MYIQTEITPNPASLKFIPDGIVVSESGNFEFKDRNKAQATSDLAYDLLGIKGVESVFFGSDFITITKRDETKWSEIKTEIISSMIDFFVLEKSAIKSDHKAKQVQSTEVEEDEIAKQIRELIEVKVRPAVAMDGGDIIFRGFEDGIVRLALKGSCSGCPSSTITLKNGIENMLKHYIPEVVGVEQVSEEE